MQEHCVRNCRARIILFLATWRLICHTMMGYFHTVTPLNSYVLFVDFPIFCCSLLFIHLSDLNFLSWVYVLAQLSLLFSVPCIYIIFRCTLYITWSVFVLEVYLSGFCQASRCSHPDCLSLLLSLEPLVIRLLPLATSIYCFYFARLLPLVTSRGQLQATSF